jgi:hypothetical protein
VIGLVVGDDAFHTAADTLESAGVATSAAQQQLSNAVRAKDGFLTEQEAEADAKRLVPGMPLGATVAAPANMSVHDGSVVVALRISGANDTFVGSVLGVPRRVQVRFNGTEYAYGTAQWAPGGGDSMELRVRVVDSTVGLVAMPVQAETRVARLDLENGTTLVSSTAGAVTTFKLQPPSPAPFAPPTLAGPPESRHVLLAIPTGQRRAWPAEVADGVSWSSPDAVYMSSDSALEEVLPIVVGRDGLNMAQVVVADGAGRRAQACVTFYLRRAPHGTNR